MRHFCLLLYLTLLALNITIIKSDLVLKKCDSDRDCVRGSQRCELQSSISEDKYCLNITSLSKCQTSNQCKLNEKCYDGICQKRSLKETATSSKTIGLILGSIIVLVGIVSLFGLFFYRKHHQHMKKTNEHPMNLMVNNNHMSAELIDETLLEPVILHEVLRPMPKPRRKKFHRSSSRAPIYANTEPLQPIGYFPKSIASHPYGYVGVTASLAKHQAHSYLHDNTKFMR